MFVQETPIATTAGPRLTRLAGCAVVAALALWAIAYVTGLWPWLGCESWSRRSNSPIGEDRAGGTAGFGPGTFVFFRGQTIVIAYDVEIRRGCLWMQVWHLFDNGPHENVSQCVSASGKGQWTVPVGETGLYRVFINSSPIRGPGPGWDMDYTVWWGAKW